MSAQLTHLTVTAVRAIHAEVFAEHGGSPGSRNESLLESGVNAPQATMMGEPLMSEPLEIAAAYLYYICRNDAFMDGNKRTALAACLVFLETNNLLPAEKLPTRDWEAFVLDVAASRIDRDQTTARLRGLLKQLSRQKK